MAIYKLTSMSIINKSLSKRYIFVKEVCKIRQALYIMHKTRTSQYLDKFLVQTISLLIIGLIFLVPRSSLNIYTQNSLIFGIWNNVLMEGGKDKLNLAANAEVNKSDSAQTPLIDFSIFYGNNSPGISFLKQSYQLVTNTVTTTLTTTSTATQTATATITITPTFTSTTTKTLSPTLSNTATDTQIPSRTPFPIIATSTVTTRPKSTQTLIQTTIFTNTIQPTVSIEGIPTIVYTRKPSNTESHDETHYPTILTLPSITPGVAERTFNKLIHTGDIVRISLLFLIISIWGIMTVGLFILLRQRKNNKDKE